MAVNYSRVFRHAITTQALARRYFPAEARERLQEAITRGEAKHRAEVRLIIEAAMPLRKVWRGMSTRQRALDLFGTFRVWDTEENNGVLLYLNMADRKAELIADRAAAKAITDAEWQAICTTMLTWFKRGAHEQGAGNAINAIHVELTEAFPANGQTENTQPDAPVML
jgi:uncharacterized membrane protein